MAKRSPVSGIDVYLERRKSRDYVGTLLRNKIEGKAQYDFVYDDHYLLQNNAIPLGPEFPLTQKKFVSKRLFPTFDDRIPSRKNPAYVEYCKIEGISPEESDSLILLSTIGRRGPSSFVFEPKYVDQSRATDIAGFRKRLDLSIREFAAAFDTSATSIQKLEIGKGSGKELLKRLEIYLRFPEVALYEIHKNRARIHSSKFQDLVRKLSETKSESENA